MKKLVNIIDDIKYRIEEINDYSCIITSNRRNSTNKSFSCDLHYAKMIIEEWLASEYTYTDMLHEKIQTITPDTNVFQYRNRKYYLEWYEKILSPEEEDELNGLNILFNDYLSFIDEK